MTAKEDLIGLVSTFDEAEACEWLARMDKRPPSRPFPSWTVMANWSDEQLDELFKKYPPETDMAELYEWEAGTASDIDSIDEY